MSNLNKFTDEFNVALKEFEAKKKVVVDKLRKDFFSLVSPIFNEYPHIKSFSWTEYTDYFNDGDECYFRVHADPDYGLEINGKDHETLVDEVVGDREFDDIPVGKAGQWYSPTYKKLSEELEAPYKAISDMIYSIPSEMMKEVFGDHVKVTVYSRGDVVVDDYSDHD